MTKLIGTDPNQVPSNADLGTLAYQNDDNVTLGLTTIATEGDSTRQGSGTLLRIKRTGTGTWATLAIEAQSYRGNSRIAFVDSDYPNDVGTTGTANGGGAAPFIFDYEHETEKFQIKSFANTRLTIDSNGDVGIGADSPSDKLEVSRTSTDQTVGLTLTNLQTGGYGSGIVWKSKRSDSPYNILDAAKIVVAGENSWNGDGNTASQMQFWTQKDNTLTKHMTLNKNGNLGIGTPSPAYSLDFAVGNTIRLRHTAAGSAIRVGASDYDVNLIRFDGATGITDNGYYGGALRYRGSRTGNNNSLSIFMDNSTGTEVEAMTFLQNGNVGIGTDTPDGKFTVSNGGAEGIEFFPAAASAVNTTQHYNRSGSAYVKNRTIALNHEWVNGATDPAMNLIPDGNSTFLVLKAKAGTFLSTANLSLYGTNPNINGGSLVSRATVQAQSDGSAFGTKLRLLTNNTSNVETRAITIDASQRVAIGTDSPGKLLTLSRSAEAQNEQLEFRTEAGGVSNGNYDGIVWTYGTNGSTVLAEQRIHYYTTGVVDMGFNLRNEDNVLYLKAGGNVGIGTSNPTRNLDVAGVLSADNYDWGSSNAVFGQDRYKIRELNNWFWAAGKRFGGYGSSSNLHDSMFDGNFDNGHTFAANSTHVITIDHRNQNTLTYPSGEAYLSFYHVQNQFTSVTGRAYHTAGSNSGNWSNLGTATDINGGPGSGGRVVKLSGPPGNYIGMWEFTIVTGSSSVVVTDLSYHMTRATGENSSPAFRVDRQQDVVHTTNFKNNSGTLVGTIVPTSSGCTFNNLSDYRFKQNVTDITGASDRLKLLKPKNFSWITDETDTLEDGFLAHEVAEVVPNAVIGEKDAVVPPELYSENDPIPEGSSVGDVKLENGEMEPQLLDQVKLIPLLTAALKEALDRIEVLEQG